MKLTELFAGQKQISDMGKTQANSASNDVINRQIRSMVPGQTIQGEVVSRSGSEVQIRLSEDLVLQARLDQNMNLEIGKIMTFEVKNNGQALTLSPLFTNMATDANVLKALDMASLPINGTTVSMTKQLMEAGLPIDRNSLQQVYREINQFPQAQSLDIVNLHKLQMPINESNVNQMASYRNLTHQLVTGLNNVLDAVPEMFSRMISEGNTEGAVKLYQQLTQLVNELPLEGMGSTGENTAGNVPENITGNSLMNQTMDGNPAPANAEGIMNMAQSGRNEAIFTEQGILPTIITEEGMVIKDMSMGEAGIQGDAPAKQVVVQEGDFARIPIPDGKNQIENPSPNISLNQQLNTASGLNLQETATQNIDTSTAKEAIKDFLNPLLQMLKQQWTITPDEVADGEQIEKLYNRLNKQLKNLAQAMESAGQTSTTAYKAVTNLSQNLDFMQQINQMYTYVQLPLRLQNQEAHGDLYVYSNKKHLASEDGKISALLHLDMEHLGPVDVYVSMVHENVNTKFYLQDDEMLDFLMGHMDILTDRLQKRGYQCSYEMQVRNQEEQPNSIQRLLQQENHVPLAEYAFDVRT